MSKFFTYLALGLLWLLHWLPLPAFVAIGRGLGSLFYWLAAPRRKVVLTNLKLCFPHLSDAERVRLAKDHFAMVARSFLERSILWFAPEARIRRLVRFKNQERFDALVGQPTPAHTVDQVLSDRQPERDLSIRIDACIFKLWKVLPESR